MLFWIKGQTKPSDKVFLMGDFNAQPTSVSYRYCNEAGFQSTYKVVNGSEPEDTFPTGLQAEFMDTDPPMCLDYVFYRGPASLRPVSAELQGVNHAPNDPTLYPSDHKALVCEFEL